MFSKFLDFTTKHRILETLFVFYASNILIFVFRVLISIMTDTVMIVLVEGNHNAVFPQRGAS